MLKRFRPQPAISADELERGLRYVTYDGVAVQVMVTFTGGAFIVAFALLLGASNFMIGIIGALQPLTQILQIPTIYFVERVGYRKLLVIGSLALSRAFCFLLMALPWLPGQQHLALFILAMLGFYGFGTISGVAWNPWIRDLIPEDRLGSYMAHRLAVLTAVSAVLSLAAAFGIDLYQKYFGETTGIYSFYFGLAGLAGLISLGFISRVPEPKLHHNPDIPILRLMMEPVRDPNFRQLLIFLGSWNFAVNFAAPFFTVYMLKRLGLSMTAVLALSVLSQGVNVLFFKLWGRLADRFSYKSVLVETGPLFIITFLLWPLTQFGNWSVVTVPALIFIFAFTGMSTAGVQLCTGNIAMKLAPRGRATAYLAVNALVSGVAATLAPILGGLAATFFENEEITFALSWHSTAIGRDVEFIPFTLRGLDFVFILAFVFGLYSLHRLVTIKEQGEVQGEVLPEFQAQVRKTLDHISSVQGLRDLFSFPYGRLVDLFNRRKSKRVSVEPGE